MISEVYSTLRTAGVPEQEARKSAEALSAENPATKNDVAEVKQALSSDIAEVRQELTSEISEVKREVAVVKWMPGIVIIAVVLPSLKPIAGI